jgi:hypothetical protein
MSWYYEAAKPPDFEEINVNKPPIGLPRPQHRTRSENQSYRGEERKLYKKIPVPWNTNSIDEESDIPNFDKDTISLYDFAPFNPYEDEYENKIINPTKDALKKSVDNFIKRNAELKNTPEYSESLYNKCCPMCGGKFEDNDPAVIYEDSRILETLSDWLPYHPHCMDLVQKHCPHIRGYSFENNEPRFSRGTYKDMLHKGILNYFQEITGDNKSRR